MIVMNQMKRVLVFHYDYVVESWNMSEKQRKNKDEDE